MSSDLNQLELARSGLALAPRRAERLLGSALDMLPLGIVLVDPATRILHANAIAREMFRAGEPILNHHGELRTTCKIAARALAEASRRVLLGGTGSRAAGASIPLPCRDGRAAVAHVRALGAGTGYPGEDDRAAVAVFITERTEHAPPPLDALTALFSLTRSEARVLEQIVSGRNRRETAAALGVADTTVKTHLEGIYSKTGTSDQLGLCRLVSGLSLPARRIANNGG